MSPITGRLRKHYHNLMSYFDYTMNKKVTDMILITKYVSVYLCTVDNL